MEPSNTTEKTRSSLARKLEIATNIAVLVAALFTGAFFVTRFLAQYGPLEESYRLAPGTRLALPEAHDFTSHERTLIMAIQEDCSYCEASMPFYRAIATTIAGCSDSGVVAVLPNPPAAADALLDRNGLQFPRLANTSLISLGITGTPTLILVDRFGTVLDVWVGQLSRDGEQDVLAAIAPMSACS